MKNNNIFKPTSFFVSTDNLSANNGQIAVIQNFTLAEVVLVTTYSGDLMGTIRTCWWQNGGLVNERVLTKSLC